MRGFVTLAVGNERYYQLALNLLKSYKYSTNKPMPFAIIADCENEYTKDFDKVVILDNPQLSYMDKLEMLNRAPWDENIFVDADCLAYGDLNKYWLNFPSGGVSCFGRALDLSSHDGWFEIGDIGEYKDKVDFIPQMHGGIIFFKNDTLTQQIYEMSLQIAEKYKKYKFKYFDKPADEPILALCMAVKGCKPVELPKVEADRMFLFLPTAENVKLDISKHSLSYSKDGVNWINNVILLHWQNVFTKTPKYHKELLRIEKNNRTVLQGVVAYAKYIQYLIVFHSVKFVRNVGHKIKMKVK